MLSITPSNRLCPESILALAPQEEKEMPSPSLWYTANFGLVQKHAILGNKAGEI